MPRTRRRMRASKNCLKCISENGRVLAARSSERGTGGRRQRRGRNRIQKRDPPWDDSAIPDDGIKYGTVASVAAGVPL